MSFIQNLLSSIHADAEAKAKAEAAEAAEAKAKAEAAQAKAEAEAKAAEAAKAETEAANKVGLFGSLQEVNTLLEGAEKAQAYGKLKAEVLSGIEAKQAMVMNIIDDMEANNLLPDQLKEREKAVEKASSALRSAATKLDLF